MSTNNTNSSADTLILGVSVEDLYVVFLACAVFLIILSISRTVALPNKVKPRLKAIHTRREELKTAYLEEPTVKEEKTTKAPPNWMRQAVDKLANLKESQRNKLSTRLIQAGYHSKDAPIIFMFTKLVGPFIGLFIGFLLVKIDWDNPFTMQQSGWWFLFILCGYLGTALPDLLLLNQRQKRYESIRLSLPDTLDLMLICAEAGLSLPASLDRVAHELGQAYPETADELAYTSVEIGFLPNRSEALTHLSQRVDIAEVRGIVNVLQQTEKYGTPIGQALRVLSKDFRTERMLRAEQKAARLPAIMTIPLIVFILPTLFIIVLTPAIIGILNQ